MEKEFVIYEQALALKELGFNENVFKVYSVKYKKLMDEEYACKYGVDCVLAPLKQQVFRWFREIYKLDISINTIYLKDNQRTQKKYSSSLDSDGSFTHLGFFDTYEEAENACIDKLTEIVK